MTRQDADPAPHRCGHAALVGRPNVGKSTLLNAMLRWHVSIAGPKPQTTRHRILGVLTRAHGQILFIDTPGMHRGASRAINRALNRAARQALGDADLVVHVVEAGKWTAEDTAVSDALDAARPRLLAVNKIDALRERTALLPYLERVSATRDYDAVYLVSARRRDGLETLERGIIERLPIAPAAFDADAVTDRSERFLAAEFVREQVMLRLGQELPYAATVEVSSFDDEDGRCAIEATIWVEREGQKAIVIGAAGAQLKAIGIAARRAIERAFERRVHLKLWVRVRENWSDDEAALRRFGYGD